MPTQDMRQLLINAGVGVLGGGNLQANQWPIFIGKEPDEPSNCVTLYDTPGDPPHPKWRLDYPRFQVRVRAVNYNTGFEKAQAVRNALLGLTPQDFNGSRYAGIYVVADTYFLLTDARNRVVFISTWRIIREPDLSDQRLPL
jgi:hypothetical protein